MDYASSVGGEVWVVSNHDNGIAFGMNAAELFHDEMGVMTVEIASWFVSENDFW